MTYEQTPTLNLNLYPQGKFAERCIGFVDDLVRWEEANQPRTRSLKKQDRLAREASCKVLLANPPSDLEKRSSYHHRRP